jgi:hypothetical protein
MKNLKSVFNQSNSDRFESKHVKQRERMVKTTDKKTKAKTSY